jgi:hypothetical protein
VRQDHVTTNNSVALNKDRDKDKATVALAIPAVETVHVQIKAAHRVVAAAVLVCNAKRMRAMPDAPPRAFPVRFHLRLQKFLRAPTRRLSWPWASRQRFSPAFVTWAMTRPQKFRPKQLQSH